MAGGATTIKVARAAGNEAAAGLYRVVGFDDVFCDRQYLRTE